MSELRMWAIAHPEGRLVHWTVRRTRKEALNRWLEGLNRPDKTWRDDQRRGYRCVRVKVEEIKK